MSEIRGFFSRNTVPFLIGGGTGFAVTKWNLLSLVLGWF